MEPVHALDNTFREEAEALLVREPEYNVIMIHNIRRFGMEPGTSPFNADYFGRREAGRLSAVGAFYGLGSCFFYGLDEGSLEGMGGFLAGLGRTPGFIGGKKAYMEVMLRELDEGLAVAWNRYDLDQSVLRAIGGGVDDGSGRPARPEEIDTLIGMSIDMEKEQFDGAHMAEVYTRELLEMHLERGTCFVSEDGGEIVSKAEGALVDGIGAHVSGVYTSPPARGRGFSTRCVAGLCARLLGDAPMVALSVDKDNYPAQAVYHKIGFEKVTDWTVVARAPGGVRPGDA